MRSTIKIQPINSLLFISDLNGGVEPTPTRDLIASSTASCISFRCFPEQDGPTEVVLGNMKSIDPGDHLVFDGELETPSRKLIVSTVERKSVLEADVPQTRSHLRIWMSDIQWPERVVIGYE